MSQAVMMRSSAMALTLSAALGVVVLLLTGLADVTPGGLVGARWYGLPLTWIRRLVIAPQYNPWRVDWTGLAADLVFWLAVALAVGWLVLRLRRR